MAKTLLPLTFLALVLHSIKPAPHCSLIITNELLFIYLYTSTTSWKLATIPQPFKLYLIAYKLTLTSRISEEYPTSLEFYLSRQTQVSSSTQSQYAHKLLRNSCMQDCQPSTTTFCTNNSSSTALHSSFSNSQAYW